MSAVRLCHLYPREMNIYADRGNIAVIQQRLERRGIDLVITDVGLGEPLRHEYDLYYLGGGQDRDQIAVAEDLPRTKAEALFAAKSDGAVVLCVCGGFQLAGHGYTAVDGSRMPGISLLDADTVAEPGRLIGDVVIDATLDGQTRQVVGFENHAGRTRRGSDCQPLGRVVAGHGNNDHDGTEGGIAERVIGTYLHGPLLPKNPWLADVILTWALEHATGHRPDLSPLDDALETSAHAAALTRVGVSR
jgi:lipid II isoglutaminyl synthase (glutamine-hydrolysing)